ncbi:acidic amino acid decarboxylase GADL1 isoform X1 [Polistes fuscatus]|uniref:acidic amino acid decarboxylase GADL1 isoform X1 n=1 Tax=Polistes fuscatus TaxID=30207 RepID=UPI001CAA3749|nr:acidic amino acid decarboxylase GADL1 isoform X1 [Polistes fuscatus]XP_043497796.1 acidic amino acid decarboxylase GADL1 isoform X1 [Polistes fuscatus]XP_043497798.1 acidic amino acid decarboxylase GADL1 isoform X1 [Polistes fuscatus]XP_043497801.1 acidic amino acid decarboxylase GADL1 isoform X1 [Polistes fuscatus]XP_043497810.1 acidic amino acid decarboxylase GADL1 isoform X1 [Polistes fuscatus]
MVRTAFGSSEVLSTTFTMSEASNDNGTLKLLEDLLRILKEEKVFNPNAHPVVNFRHPTDLKEILSFKLKDDGSTSEEIEAIIRKIIKYSVKTFSPNFHNQLFAGVDKYGLVGSWLTEVLNTSQYTYEVGPVFTLIEQEIINECLKLVDYPPTPDADGILCPGGSISNMYAMVMARYKILPDIKKKGSSAFPPLACFTSEEGHYSIMKAAHWLGIGTDQIYKIKTDELGKMIPTELRNAIKEAKSNKKLPFFVNATCGTTVLGAFDPLPEIAKICKDESLWMHVDACLGGTLLLCHSYRDRLSGIELSDSVSWNPHKMLGVPLQCSIFLVKGKKALHETNCAGAKYLFQQDKFYDVSYDTGDKSVQCGRKVDAMKFWLMWKAHGTIGLNLSVQVAMSAAEYFRDRIKYIDGFRLVLPNYECSNICFWYIPSSMRNKSETQEWWDKLSRVTTSIKEKMVLDGTLMIGYTPLPNKNLVNFFRMVVTCHPPPSHTSMDYAIKLFQRYGENF